MVSLKGNRAAQRRRNALAKEVKLSKLFKPKRIDKKKVKVNMNDIRTKNWDDLEQ